MQMRSAGASNAHPCRSTAASSAAKMAGTPTIAETPSCMMRSTAVIALKRAMVETLAPAMSGAIAEPVRPKRCEYGSSASR